MCGIVGAIQTGISSTEWQDRLQAMTDALRHRGPDDQGIWFDPAMGIGLGHRRLSILDLSPAGHQPMWSADRRFVVVFNGEIYNFMALRHELETMGHSFRGRSDTEVMLAAFSRWGVEKAIQRFNGMFAFAVWDHINRALYLARDRMGEKPLYYGWMGSAFLFGSELKALRAHPEFRPEIDPGSLALYLKHAYIHAPFCIFKDMYKLPAGCILTVPAQSTDRPEPVPYWSVKEAVRLGLSDRVNGNESDTVDELEHLLQDAVRSRMVADVPVGAFLSGGVDSSLVVALMQQASSRPVKTFSIGFYEEDYNEAGYAKAVAQHLGTDHTELYVDWSDASSIVLRIPEMYDEPFADSSQIPTFLISQLARQQVTVSLSGDGGDELFAGYSHYLSRRALWNKLERIPYWLRYCSGKIIRALPDSSWGRMVAWMPFSEKNAIGTRGDKIRHLGELLTIHEFDTFFLSMNALWRTPEELVNGLTDPIHPMKYLDMARTPEELVSGLTDPIHHMKYLDMMAYLPEDILTKVDRASMSVSLEVRVPLLDHRVVEYTWRLPLGMNIRDGKSKWVVQQVLYRYVPSRLIERPKMGFGVPVGAWLRGPLREWAESLLAENRLRQAGVLNAEPIRKRWSEHVSGRANWQDSLWCVLMFQAWQERWG